MHSAALGGTWGVRGLGRERRPREEVQVGSVDGSVGFAGGPDPSRVRDGAVDGRHGAVCGPADVRTGMIRFRHP